MTVDLPGGKPARLSASKGSIQSRYKHLLLAIGAAFKVAILIRFGPFVGPDTGGYTALAQAMLSGSQFFREVPDWATSALPTYAFRPIGYPLIIAGA